MKVKSSNGLPEGGILYKLPADEIGAPANRDHL